MFVYTQPKKHKKSFYIPIKKLSAKKPEYEFLHAIADNMAGFVRGSLVYGVETFKNKTQFGALAQAMADGNKKAAFDAIPWKDFNEIDGMTEIYEDSVLKAAKSIQKTFPKVLQPKIRFDITNPRIVTWIEKNTASLVTNLTRESEKAVKDAIRRTIKTSFQEGLPPRKSAKLIKEVIGLNKPQEVAVMNFRDGLIEAGFSGDILEGKVAKFTQQKLKERSILIARTETINAVNAAQQEVWEQAFEGDLIDEDTEKEWIVTPDDRLCPICANPKVNGQRVKFKEYFTIWLPSGGALIIEVKAKHPTAHPRCRCAMKLIFK